MNHSSLPNPSKKKKKKKKKRKRRFEESTASASESETVPKKDGLLDEYRKNLPVYPYRQQLVEAIYGTASNKNKNQNKVVLITASTGSGKSTQIPAYILEQASFYGCIAVTQPRRVAAITYVHSLWIRLWMCLAYCVLLSIYCIPHHSFHDSCGPLIVSFDSS